MKESTNSWKPGEKINTPINLNPSNFQKLNFSSLGAGERYRFMISTIIPRPIALVSTVNSNGQGNLAPFSFYTGISSNPPCLIISIAAHPEGRKKHTLKNIEDTKEFVVNMSPEWLFEPLVYAAADYPEDINELEHVGLTKIPSSIVKPPRVAESPVHFECKLHSIIPIGTGAPGSSTLVIGEILEAHVWSDAIKNNRVDPKALNPIARLGGAAYSSLGEIKVMPIPEIP